MGHLGKHPTISELGEANRERFQGREAADEREWSVPKAGRKDGTNMLRMSFK